MVKVGMYNRECEQVVILAWKRVKPFGKDYCIIMGRS